MAKINAHGATLTTLQEYLQQVREAYRAIDPAWNIEPESPDGMALAIWSELLANLDEQVLNAYRSVDPNTAVGQQLDRIATLSGITRHAATYSTAAVTFTGADSATIPAGTLIRHATTDTLWATDAEAVIADRAATVGVTCTEAGAQSAAAGELSIIATPIGGVRSVTNPAAASLGLDEEPDSIFRVRRNASVALPGTSQLDSLYAAVANVDGVKQARIYENADSTPNSLGLRGHSLAVFVDGGENETVLRAIAAKKNPGVGLNRESGLPGRVTADTTTPAGQPISITFFRPEHVDVYVQVEIADSTLSAQDKTKITDEIVRYSQLGYTSGPGFNRQGFRIGEPVSAGRLYTPVNSIIAGNGYVRAIYVSTNAEHMDQLQIPIAFNQLGVLDHSHITVENA